MTIGPEDWDAQEPSPDFVDRTMARMREESGAPPAASARRKVSVRAGIAATLALAAGIVLAVGWRGSRWAERGDAVAASREEVHLGGRAIAVLERGAHVIWSGDDVQQPAGDVFYRVEPGGSFRVHTPGGDVQVLGTCFRVSVGGAESVGRQEESMNGRDVKAGAVGAALAATAFVSVYEGKVALSHAGERVTLIAGESARIGATGAAHGVTTTSNYDEAAKSADPLVAANANLVDSVRDYKRRLEAIEAQKTSIAKELADAQEKLARAQNDGQATPKKSEYDLSQDDWKELAKEGRVVARTPCAAADSWNVSPKTLDAVGLPAQDGQVIHDVLQQSAQRVWATLRPLCIQALQGDAHVADRLGPSTCQALVHDVAKQQEDTDEEVRAAAEMRAGLRPVDPKALGSFGQMLYQMSGEAPAIEQQLAQTIGPDAARRFTYGEDGNWCNSSWGAGPRPILPGQRSITDTSGGR